MSFVALWLGVGVLGGLGAIARFLLDAFVSVNTGARFPLGTLLVNLSGALVWASVPPNLPIAVRVAETMTGCCMVQPPAVASWDF